MISLGYVTNVKFCSLLIKGLEMKIEDMENIVSWLDPRNIGKISTQYFLKLLKEIPPES